MCDCVLCAGKMRRPAANYFKIVSTVMGLNSYMGGDGKKAYVTNEKKFAMTGIRE